MADKNNPRRSWWADQSGISAVLFALLAATLVGLIALSVDVGHIGLVRTELQNAADACALAGARGFLPNTVPPLGSPQPPPDPTTALSVANGWIGRNPADNRVLKTLSVAQVGIYNYTTGTLDTDWSHWPPPLGTFTGPGITVTVQKQGGVNDGPIRHALAAIFGVTASDAQATAIAALSGVGSTGPGQANFPGAITKPSAMQTTAFVLNPNGGQTGAWTTFFDKNTNWKSLTEHFADPSSVPPTKVGDQINMSNGDITKTFTAPEVGLEAVWASHPKPWIVVMPVINASPNPVGLQTIIGYASFEIIDVKGVPEKTVTLRPVSGYLGGGAGGGGLNFGLWSLEPKLVQ